MRGALHRPSFSYIDSIAFFVVSCQGKTSKKHGFLRIYSLFFRFFSFFLHRKEAIEPIQTQRIKPTSEPNAILEASTSPTDQKHSGVVLFLWHSSAWRLCGTTLRANRHSASSPATFHRRNGTQPSESTTRANGTEPSRTRKSTPLSIVFRELLHWN